jgi:hypothetical protein
MKKTRLWQLILSFVIVLSSCGGGGGGNDDGGGGGNGGGTDCSTSGVIDVSNTSTATGGYTFGTETGEQAKRFQTFIADNHTALESVEVKVKKNSAIETYNAMTVELYRTSEHKPTIKIAETTVDAASINSSFAVIKANLKYQSLVPGIEYAVVLGQVDHVTAANSGFAWIVADVDHTLSFGKFSDKWNDESSFGDGWLIAYVSGGVCASVKHIYTGTITVENTGGIVNPCIITYNKQESFDVVLDYNPSYPSTDGIEWQNTQPTIITGSINDTSTCTPDINTMTSNGSQTITMSSSNFPVILIITNYGYYRLVVGNAPFSCTWKWGPVTGILYGGLVDVSPIPADPSVLSGERTISGPATGMNVKITWYLKRIDL